MVITINHPPVSSAEITKLSSTVAVGATTLPVQSNSIFVANDYVVVGKIGVDQSEIRKVSALVSTNQLTIDALIRAHPVDADVQIIRYNKLRVYRSTSEGGTYTEISGSPFDLEIDKSATVIDDPVGTADSWYKISYFNSTSSEESALSDAMQGSGAKRGATRQLIESVRFHMDLDDDNVASNEQIMRLFNEGIDDIQSSRGYKPQNATRVIDTVNGESEYDLPSDFLSLRNIYIDRSGLANQLVEMPYNRLYANVTSSSLPGGYGIYGGKIIFDSKFSDTTGKIKIAYQKKIPYVNSDNDVPDMDNPEVLVAFACMSIAVAQQNRDKATFWTARYADLKRQLIRGHRSATMGFNKTRRPGYMADGGFRLHDIEGPY